MAIIVNGRFPRSNGTNAAPNTSRGRDAQDAKRTTDSDATRRADEVIGTSPGLVQHPDGTFSISELSGYPAGVALPPTNSVYRLLTGTEYAEARRLANRTNAKLRRQLDIPAGHEIIPVKYGGSPTDLDNKVFLPRDVHRRQVTP